MPHNPLGREVVVKRLKTHAKSPHPHDELEAIGETLYRETDRGAVILLASMVEDVLENRIVRAMVPLNSEERTRLFGPDAPVGTFSAKIRLAYALGAVDRDISRMCELLREMRNACAHSRRDISFRDPALRDVFLVYARSCTSEDLSDGRPENMKLVFCLVTSYLSKAIASESRIEAAKYVNRLLAETLQEIAESVASSRPKKRLSKGID